MSSDLEYSDSEMLEWIQKLAHKGVPPTTQEIDEHPEAPSYTLYNDRFGSLQQAIEKAGFQARSCGMDKYHYILESEEGRDIVLQRMRELADDDGTAPTVDEWNECEDMPPHSVLVDYYGSYNDAIEAAGLEPNLIQRSWSKDEIIEFACEYADSHDELPREIDFKDIDGGPTSSTVSIIFDSYTEAVRERGYDVREWRSGHKTYTEEELLSWLDAFVTEFGVIPTAPDLRDGPMPSPLTYADRFGSLAAAIEEAGYEAKEGMARSEDGES